MKKNKKYADTAVEGIMVLLILLIILVMIAALAFIFIIPINNYHYADGYVEYKNQYRVVSQIEGVITNVYMDNYAHVKGNEPLARVFSESSQQEIKALSVRMKFLDDELKRLYQLFSSGAVSRSEVERKKLEIHELRTRRQFLEKNTIHAPVEGNVYYKILPQNIKGSFISRGEVLAYIYDSEDKHVRVTFPNTFADRFKIGMPVLIRYRDPVRFHIQKMKGVIYKTFINKEDGTIELYCGVTEGREIIDLFQPSTMVSTAIVINSTSVCQDFIGIDLYSHIKDYIEQSWIYRYVMAE
jgi:multidrug resistance efflux pump